MNPTTFIEATYGWVQNQLGSMIVTDVSNRFNAGLGGLPLLFPDAGVIDSRYYENKPLKAVGTPYFDNGRILLPPTFAWGNRVAANNSNTAPPSLGFPGFMNINRTQDFSISLTKVTGPHTIKGGFYLNHSYKAQNLGAGGGASFQGNISFANDTANPLDTGFGFANAALGIFTTYQQQSKFVEGSFLYDQVDWYLQDNWKVDPKLTLDYGLRFVNQRPQYDQYLQASNFFPEQWQVSAAPFLYTAGCVNNANPCSGNNRQAMNPLTNQLLGPNTSLAIGQLVPNNGNALNGIIKAGDGIAKGNYEWPTIGYAPRFGVAYDMTGAQRFILRGGAGLFCRQRDSRIDGALDRSASTVSRAGSNQSELGNRNEHIPFHPIVVQSPVPRWCLVRTQLHAGAVEHRNCRQSRAVATQRGWQLRDSRRSSRG